MNYNYNSQTFLMKLVKHSKEFELEPIIKWIVNNCTIDINDMYVDNNSGSILTYCIKYFRQFMIMNMNLMNLKERLISEGHEVIGIDNLSHPCKFHHGKFRKKDITSITKRDLKGVDWIVHLAAQIRMVLVNYFFSLRYSLFVCVMQISFGVSVVVFIFLSSMHF